MNYLHDSSTDGMHQPTNEAKKAAEYFIGGPNYFKKKKEDKTAAKAREDARDTYVNVKQMLKKLDAFPTTAELRDGRFPTVSSITGALGFWKCK